MNWFTRFTYQIKRFMAGRHGSDQLSFALLIAYVILSLIANLTRLAVFSLLGTLLLIWGMFRILSRNHSKRWKENAVFMKYWSRISKGFRGSSQEFSNWQQRKTERIRDKQLYRYYKCPHCKSTLRVPKGKGKIVITCPVCKTEFTKKT